MFLVFECWNACCLQIEVFELLFLETVSYEMSVVFVSFYNSPGQLLEVGQAANAKEQRLALK